MNTATLSRRLTSDTVAIALAHFTLELFHNFLPIVYPLLIIALGLTYGQIGTIALTVGIFSALTQPLFGYLADRWDPRLIVVGSIAWSGALMGLVGFVGNYWLLIPAVALGALGSAAFHPAGVALATARVSRRPGASLSIFSVGGNLGSALSPLLVGLSIDQLGRRGTGLLLPVGLLFSFVLYRQLSSRALVQTRPAGAGRPSSTPGRSSGASSGRGSWFVLAMIIVIVAARSWFQGSLLTYTPEWLQSGGMSLEATGPILSVFLVCISIGSLTGGSLSDRVGDLPIVFTSLALMAPVHWLYLHSGGFIQILSIGLLGVLTGATFPVAILMAQKAWPHAVGLASSLVIGLGWLPSGIGAWVVGLIADHSTLTVGMSSLLIVPLFGLLAGILLAIHQRLALNRPPR